MVEAAETINFCCWGSEYPEIKKRQRQVVLFTGTPDETGKSWCSDCNTAKPFIEQIIIPWAESNNIPFQIITVGDRPTWKNPEHVLRTDQSLKLTSVPTLILYEQGTITKRLDDDKATKEDFIKMFIEE